VFQLRAELTRASEVPTVSVQQECCCDLKTNHQVAGGIGGRGKADHDSDDVISWGPWAVWWSALGPDKRFLGTATRYPTRKNRLRTFGWGDGGGKKEMFTESKHERKSGILRGNPCGKSGWGGWEMRSAVRAATAPPRPENLGVPGNQA